MIGMCGGRLGAVWVAVVALLLCHDPVSIQAFQGSFSRRCSYSSTAFSSSLSRRQNGFLGCQVVHQVPGASVSSLSSSSLSMHMGHSHSHNHDNFGILSKVNNPPVPPNNTNEFGRRRRRVRQLVLVLFCALATMGPRLLWRREIMIRNADVAAFCVSTVALASADNIRRQVLEFVQRIRSTVQSVAKHSPPLQNYVQISTDSATRVTVIGVVINFVLSVGKLAIGIASHSSALIADAGHSLSDLFSDFVTLYTVQLARLPPDDDHPYGHGKFESIGSLFLALTLLATGVSVGILSNKKLVQIVAAGEIGNAAGAMAAGAEFVELPKAPALIMALISIVSKEWLFRITRVVGQRLNSQVVLANAWHHRTDAYSSVLAFFSIGLAMSVPGMLAADSFAGLLVAGMICMTGVDILGESIKQLSDTNNEALVQCVRDIVSQSSEVQTVQFIRARQVGSKAWVDVRFTVAPDSGVATTTLETSALEQRIRHEILTDPVAGNLIMDAEVRAMVPPLLEDTDDHDHHHHKHEHDHHHHDDSVDKTTDTPAAFEHTTTVLTTLPRVCDVQEKVRERARGMKGIQSVQEVAVQFLSSATNTTTTNNNKNNPLETTTTSVQVHIRMHGSTSVSQARKHAIELRDKLEASSTIDQATIFLDLNDDSDDDDNDEYQFQHEDHRNQDHNHQDDDAIRQVSAIELPNPAVTTMEQKS